MGRPKKNIESTAVNTGSHEKQRIESMISRGIFSEALRAERFGPHPGFVSVKLRLSLYNAMNKKEERLPGKVLELLVSSIEEVDDLVRLMEKIIKMWIRGEIVP